MFGPDLEVPRILNSVIPQQSLVLSFPDEMIGSATVREHSPSQSLKPETVEQGFHHGLEPTTSVVAKGQCS